MAMRARRRFSTRRRRPFSRKRVFRKKRFASGSGGRHDVTLGSSLMNQSAWDYKRKPFNKRKFVRRLKAASDAATHHRSIASVTGVATTAIVLGQQNVFFRALVEDAGGGLRFWQTAGGLVTADGDTATTSFGGGDLFLRGGLCKHSFHNNGVVDVKLRTWVGRTTLNGQFPAAAFSVSNAWDPSVTPVGFNDPRDKYSFRKEMTVILKPGEAWERADFVGAQKIDQDQWINNLNRDIFIYSLENMTSVVASTLQVVANYNLSFTGDRDVA